MSELGDYSLFPTSIFTAFDETLDDLYHHEDLIKIIQGVCQRIVKILDVSSCEVYLKPLGKNLLELAALYGVPRGILREKQEIGNGFSGAVAKKDAPILLVDPQDWNDLINPDQFIIPKIIYGMPLKNHDDLIGVITITDHKKRSFSLEDQEIISSFSKLLVIAVENKTLLRKIQQGINERRIIEASEKEHRILVNALDETASTLTSTLDLSEVLDLILEIVARVVPFDAATIMLIDSGMVRIVRSRGYLERGLADYISHWCYPLKQLANLSRMAETGLPLYIPDTQDDPNWISYDPVSWLRSNAAAPIRVKGALIGFLHVDSATPNFFTPMHAERLQAFADHVGAAIENARLFEDTQKKARQFALLNEITQAAISAPDLQSMLDILAHRLGELIDADGAYITMWDAETQRAIPAASYAMRADRYQEISNSAGEQMITTTVLEAQQVIAIDDVNNTPYIDAAIAGQFPEKSILAIPLIADETKLGAAIVGFRTFHHFSINEVNLAQQVSSQIALALARRISLDNERKQAVQINRANNFIHALNQVATKINNFADASEMLETLGNELAQLKLESMVIQINPETSRMIFKYISTESRIIQAVGEKYLEIVEKMAFSPEDVVEFANVIGNTGIYLEDPSPIVTLLIKNFQEVDYQEVSQLAGINSGTRIMALPLAVESQTTGYLFLWGDDLLVDDLPTISIFASQIAVNMENARLYNDVQRLAITDELSGLYNRRGLFQVIKREIDRQQRFHHPLSVMMMDIDHFKEINDQYGHITGDQIINELGKRCLENIRGIDVGGRYGGEEFFFLLIENSLSQAVSVAERLRANIAEKPFKTDKGNIFITVSLGVVEIDENETKYWKIIEKVDKALYQAKSLGRNRVASLS